MKLHHHIRHHIVKHRKLIVYFLITGIILFWLFLIWGNLYYEKFAPRQLIHFGVSFSPKQAAGLGLDWTSLLPQALDDLPIQRLRLPSYWDVIESPRNQFDFAQLDFMLNQARIKRVPVLLVLGYKQPGWPECFVPDWALKLSSKERQEANLSFISRVVTRYRLDSNIWGYQVENEPLLRFGLNCDEPDRNYLKKEVQLVKSLDPQKPIVVTDSGELRAWRTPMRLSDVFGTTLYRSVFDRIFGYLHYPIPPAFYSFKSNAARLVFAPNNKRSIITEFQAEPWAPGSLREIPLDSQMNIFSPQDLENSLDFAKKTGFDEIYLWGVEWWYFMKDKGHPEYLEIVKQAL